MLAKATPAAGSTPIAEARSSGARCARRPAAGWLGDPGPDAPGAGPSVTRWMSSAVPQSLAPIDHRLDHLGHRHLDPLGMQGGHRSSGDAAGHDVFEHLEIGGHVEREAVGGPSPRGADADGADLPRSREARGPSSSRPIHTPG